MGYEYETKRFTPDNHEALAAQVIPHIGELVVGDIVYADEEHVLIDGTPERKTWIYKCGKVMLSAEDVIEVCMDAYDGDEGQPSIVRLIVAEEGIVVDQSHEDKKYWESLEARYNRDDARYLEEHPEEFLPVIYRAHNYEELELIEEALALGSNIVLPEDSDLEEILDTVNDLILEAEGIGIDADLDIESDSDD